MADKEEKYEDQDDPKDIDIINEYTDQTYNELNDFDLSNEESLSESLGIYYGSADDALDESPMKMSEVMSENNTYNRTMLARNLQDMFVKQSTTKEGILDIFEKADKLVEDEEDTIIIIELMQQLPQLAKAVKEKAHMFPEINDVVAHFILPYVLKFWMVKNNQVRKTGQAGLLVLMDQGLLSESVLNQTVYPIIAQLAKHDTFENFLTESITLMSQLAPIIGRVASIRVFLPLYSSLCTNVSFQVRKICALNFGTFCTVIGQKHTEDNLLDKFHYLCEDAVWGVRKCCAECIMEVSEVCSMEKRKQELAPIFHSALICDQSRWVRTSAFHSLGAFIATFADATNTGLSLDDKGQVIFDSNFDVKDVSFETDTICDDQEIAGDSNDNDGECFNNFQYWRIPFDDAVLDLIIAEESGKSPPSNVQETTSSEETSTCSTPTSSTPTPSTPSSSSSDEISSSASSSDTTPTADPTTPTTSTTTTTTTALAASDSNTDPTPTTTTPAPTASDPTLSCHDDGEPNSAPGLSQALEDTVDDNTCQEQVALFGTTNVIECTVREDFSSSIAQVNSNIAHDLKLSSDDDEDNEEAGVDGAAAAAGEDDDDAESESTAEAQEPLQDIVPQLLLDQFLSMADQRQIKAVDSDIPIVCAYNIPAVAFTLGRKNWICLRYLYEQLANNMQWKVRRTLAFSIHELGMIIGPDLTSFDLVPIFDGFLRDLDDVRIGVLKHFADFLKLLNHEKRLEYLKQLGDFLKMDNNKNWRFRLELAEQMILLTTLFKASDIYEFTIPIVFELAFDSVSEVRHKSYAVMSSILKKLHAETDKTLFDIHVELIQEKFPNSSSFRHRKGFQHICEFIAIDKAIPCEVFVEKFYNRCIAMATDPVVNVRHTTLNTLSTFITSGYFPEDSSNYKTIAEARDKLSNEGNVRNKVKLNASDYSFEIKV